MADKEKNQLGPWFIMLLVIAAIVTSGMAKQHMQGNAAVGIGGCTIALLAVAKFVGTSSGSGGSGLRCVKERRCSYHSSYSCRGRLLT